MEEWNNGESSLCAFALDPSFQHSIIPSFPSFVAFFQQPGENPYEVTEIQLSRTDNP